VCGWSYLSNSCFSEKWKIDGVMENTSGNASDDLAAWAPAGMGKGATPGNVVKCFVYLVS